MNRSETVATDLNDKIRKSIEQFISDFEQRYNIHIFYVSETSSRPCGVEVINSDFDLIGFYLSHPSDSLRIIPKIKPQYKEPHNKIIISGKEYDVDVEFLDIREFGLQKVRDHIIHLDYALFSPTIYFNKYPQLIEDIKSRLVPSPDEFMFKFLNLQSFCEKSLSKSGDCWIKKLLSALICGVQYFYVYVYDAFPEHNIWLLISNLKSQFESLNSKNIIDKSEQDLLEKVFDLIAFYYEQKKTMGRKCVIDNISPYQIKFLEWLQRRFPHRKKKNFVINFDLSYFEKLSNEVLRNWLGKTLPNMNKSIDQ